MKRFHVVRKQGLFIVYVAQNWSRLGVIKTFHSYDNAMRYYRYHVSYLGWNYGTVQFVSSCFGEVISLAYTDRGE